MKQTKQVWILETHEGVRRLYRECLGLRHSLNFFSEGSELVACLQDKAKTPPELLIAEPNGPGSDFINYLEASPPDEPRELPFPFVIVSALDDVDLIRFCFARGAEDFLVKPFHKSELIAKSERILSRFRAKTLLGDSEEFHLDPINLTITRMGEISDPLTLKEYQILTVLRSQLVQGVSRDYLRKKIWGKISISHKALDVHLFNLRKKIKTVGLEVQFEPKVSRYFLYSQGSPPTSPTTTIGLS